MGLVPIGAADSSGRAMAAGRQGMVSQHDWAFATRLGRSSDAHPRDLSNVLPLPSPENLRARPSTTRIQWARERRRWRR